jgi:hypothetical protein
MKLSETQIAEIEKYILDCEIEYREFFDEMLDHFVTDIEAQMKDGSDFYSAFHITAGKFSGKSFDKRKHSEYFGLKAFEMESIYDYERSYKSAFWKQVLLQFYTYRILFWVFFVFFLIRNPLLIKPYFIVLLILLLGIYALLYTATPPKITIKNIFNKKNINIEDRKKLLKSNMKIHAIFLRNNAFYAMILNSFNIINMMRSEKSFEDFNFFNFTFLIILYLALVSNLEVILRFRPLKLKIQWP